MIVGPDIVVMRNPKAASTSLAHAFRKQGKAVLPAHSIDAPERPRVVGMVRNPFDRIISGWRQYERLHVALPLLDYLCLRDDPVLSVPFQHWPQEMWLKRCTDIWRVEAAPSWLPMKNASGTRPDRRRVFDSVTRQIVEKRFAPDLERWGYDFAS